MTDKYVTPESLPAPYESEILEIMAEECNEVGQRKSKVLRFGFEEVQPNQPLTNKERLSREVGDLLFMIHLMLKLGLLDPLQIRIGETSKPDQLRKYMQNTPPDDHLALPSLLPSSYRASSSL